MDQNQALLHTKQNQELHDPSTILVTTLNKPQEDAKRLEEITKKDSYRKDFKVQSKHYKLTDQEKPFLDYGRKTGQNFQSTFEKTRAALQQQQTQRSSEILQLGVCILNKNLKQHIELFQAERTKSCLPIWRSLTSDREILTTASGLTIDLEGKIPLELRIYNCSQAQQDIIDNEI